MAKNNEAIEEIADDVSELKRNYGTIANDVDSIKGYLKTLADAANKPMPSPTLSQSVVNTVVSGAIGEYFRTHPVGTTFTEDDKEALAQLLYTKYSVASENYTENRKKYDEEQLQKREEKRRIQGFETHDQIAEWAPEFPEDVRTWMRFIGDRTIKLESSPEFAKTQLRCVGELFMAAKGLHKPTIIGYLKFKWQEFKQRTDKWQLWKWYLLLLGLMAIMVMHQEYQSRVMKLEKVNHIFYNHIMSDPVKAKEYHDIDSLVNTQPVLKKLWEMP